MKIKDIAVDEIILNTPYYFNQEMAITMANCQPVLVETDENYQLQPDAIASKLADMKALQNLMISAVLAIELN